MEVAPKYFVINEIGDSTLGYIAIAEYPGTIPFEIKRVYWTYFTPNNVIRGHHAHKRLEQIIFAVSGIITFSTEDRNGVRQEFVLDSPNKGLYIPPLVWREIKFSHNAVLVCLASMEYSAEDYIRDYDEFRKWI